MITGEHMRDEYDFSKGKKNPYVCQAVEETADNENPKKPRQELPKILDNRHFSVIASK